MNKTTVRIRNIPLSLSTPEDAHHYLSASEQQQAEKIHIAADAHGNPIDFEITWGEVHDVKMATNPLSLLRAF